MNYPCKEMQDKMADYVLGVLSREEIDALHGHTNQCPECRKYIQALKGENRLLVQLAEELEAGMAAREDSVIEALNRRIPAAHVKPLSIFRAISKSPITKLAAAAVIIVTIGFFIVQQRPGEQPGTVGTLEVAKSPAEMMTMASFTFAYRRGGIEAVEEICDKAFRMVGPRPATISIQELFEESNG